MCEFVDRNYDEIVFCVFCCEKFHIFNCGVVFPHPFKHVVLWQFKTNLLRLHIFEHVEVIVHVIDDALCV